MAFQDTTPPQIIADMTAEASKLMDAAASAVVVLNGIDALIEAAEAKILENGATEEQLRPLADLQSLLMSSQSSLAAAVAARVPPVEPPPVEPPVEGRGFRR
jgi:hypothetical protein